MKERDPSPDPGKYDKHLTKFGKDVHRVHLNMRPRDQLFKIGDNPGPGIYNPNASDQVTKHRLVGGLIQPPALKLYTSIP